MSDIKPKIISKIRAGYQIPANSLSNYINEGIVSLSELLDAGLKDPELGELKANLQEHEAEDWKQICEIDTSDVISLVYALVKYISNYEVTSIGDMTSHLREAHTLLANSDDDFWKITVESSPTREALEEYLRLFPNGSKMLACTDMLSDMPWLETRKLNTIKAYEKYKADYPGKHIDEIDLAIQEIKDEENWHTACGNNTTSGYQTYLDLHPEGRHKKEAQEKIDNRSGKEILLQELRENRDKYSPYILQQKVDNNVISWKDLAEIFDTNQIEAIKKWQQAANLQFPPAPEKLQRGLTEVYFWGLKTSGKTCALGAILSAAKNIYKISSNIDCPGAYYRDTLANLFSSQAGDICTLPTGNPLTNNVSEMSLYMSEIPEATDSEYRKKQKRKRRHKMTLIDLAGESITGIYRAANPTMFPNNPTKDLVEQVKKYLEDDYNKKIHFFIVEYGKSDGIIDGITQSDILDKMASYLENKKIFRKSTVGVYVIVTKTDKIPCEKEERPQKAYDYVENQLGGFWENLQRACDEAGISAPITMSFSIGDVFAQNLCKFDGADTRKIIQKLLTKTPVESWWDKLRQ